MKLVTFFKISEFFIIYACQNSHSSLQWPNQILPMLSEVKLNMKYSDTDFQLAELTDLNIQIKYNAVS